ncbi:MAG TPA: YdcF family protein [Gaiellaceae bacterium]|nr:YdcF family protein [Gaiellaceae bacterium]
MIRRLLLVLAVLVGLWLVACAFLFVWPRADSPPKHADAVVVLSGGLDRRLDPAVALVRDGVAPNLVISSPTRGKWPQARALCGGGKKIAGVRVVCFQPDPYSTQGEARAVAAMAQRRGWSRVVVVTSTFHVTRARMLIERCYHRKLWVTGSSWPWWQLPEEWASETGKLLVQLTVQRGC